MSLGNKSHSWKESQSTAHLLQVATETTELQIFQPLNFVLRLEEVQAIYAGVLFVDTPSCQMRTIATADNHPSAFRYQISTPLNTGSELQLRSVCTCTLSRTSVVNQCADSSPRNNQPTPPKLSFHHFQYPARSCLRPFHW